MKLELDAIHAPFFGLTADPTTDSTAVATAINAGKNRSCIGFQILSHGIFTFTFTSSPHILVVPYHLDSWTPRYPYIFANFLPHLLLFPVDRYVS